MGTNAALSWTYSATNPIGVELAFPTYGPSISHWGTSVIMDGRFDDDKSLVFIYGQRSGTTIGANATIVCGHDIGKYAFIGAGAVVTKHIPDYALVVGNPSRQIGWMSEYGHRLEFNNEGLAVCKESGQQYKLENNIVTRIK